MKTKYLKGIVAMSFTTVALLMSSCLKDNRYFDPLSTTANLAELPLSGLNNFAVDAVTKAGVDTITFAVGVTAANPPSSPTTVTIGVDNTIVTSYNAANTAIAYLPVPAAAFKLPASNITIPAGKNSTLATVIIDRTQLDPTLSYMLPVKIVSAGGLPISANYGIHYYHVIGNDFAGAYLQDFIRTPAGGNFTGGSTVISPDSPTQLEAISGYAGLGQRYIITFTKNGSGSSATYTNFSVVLNPDDVKNVLGGSGITVATPASFVNYDKTHAYTYAEVTHGLLTFTYDVLNSAGAPRNIVDKFYKP